MPNERSAKPGMNQETTDQGVYSVPLSTWKEHIAAPESLLATYGIFLLWTGSRQSCFFSSDLERFVFCFQSDQIKEIVKSLIQPSVKINSFKSKICKPLQIFGGRLSTKKITSVRSCPLVTSEAAKSWARSFRCIKIVCSDPYFRIIVVAI